MATGKIVSSTECARIFGVTPQTVYAWLEAGMPYVKKPEVKQKSGWEIDCADVLKWHGERARKDGKLQGSRMTDYDAAKARKMDADAHVAELNLALKLGKVVFIETVTAVVSKHIGAARAKLLSLPSKLAKHLAADDTPGGCQFILEGSINEALEELSGSEFDPDEFTTEPGEPEELSIGDVIAGSEGMGSPTSTDDLGMGG